MTTEEAAKITRRLLAGFPNLGAHDPEGYIVAMIEVMSGYPLWAGQRMIVRVDEENPQFPPSDRVLRTWLEDAVRPYRFVQEWEERAAKQLVEREQIEAEREPIKESAERGVIITNFDAVKGRPNGPFEAGRKLPYRG